jgi:hypothetical protein
MITLDVSGLCRQLCGSGFFMGSLQEQLMLGWFDKWLRNRRAEDPPTGPERASKGEPDRASGAQRRVEHEPHRWRRGDRATMAADWEVAAFYDSLESPRP